MTQVDLRRARTSLIKGIQIDDEDDSYDNGDYKVIHTKINEQQYQLELTSCKLLAWRFKVWSSMALSIS